MKSELHHGDCLDVLKTLADCSVDAIVTDPPYGLGKEPDPVKVMAAWILQGYFEVEGSGFMGKKWDAFVPQPIIWKEVFRVLKPGGHLLAFAGTRTQDWMAMSLRFAGFEIRDMIAWVYGSGMPKSFNLKRSGVCDCVPAENALPYTYEQNTKHDVRPLQNGDLQEAGPYGKERGQILLPILPKQGEHSDGQAREKPQASDGKQPGMEGREVYRAEERVCDDSPTGSPPSQTERLRTGAYLGSGKDARKAAGGKRGGSSQEQEPSGQPTGKPASVLKPLGTLDEGALHGCGQCQRCGKIKKNLEGFGTTLKPSLEPITLARKPPIGTVATNVLQHGTGGLNIDGCRVGDTVETWPATRSYGGGTEYAFTNTSKGVVNSQPTGKAPEGRWPANFIHDGSEEVLALLGEAARFFMVFQDKEVSLLPENQYNEQLAKGGQSWQTKNDPLFLAGTAAKSLSLPKALEFIAQSVVATSDHQEVTASSDSKGHSIYVTQEELKTLCECVTTAMMILGNGFSLESKLEKHTLTKSLVKVAATKEPTGITTIMTSLLKFDGSAENATLRITQKSTALGGQAYRIAYIPKASRDDRDEGCGAFEERGNNRYGEFRGTEDHAPKTQDHNKSRNPHPTVKPTDLMRYLCRLITPPGGIVLDPFMGSGSTGKAAMAEGFRFIGIEREAEYIEIARARISAEAEKPRQLSLF